MRKSILFTSFTLEIIAVCFCASNNSPFLDFKLACSKQLDSGFRTAAGKSAIGCCQECAKDSLCGAVSVNAAAGVCTLLDVSPDNCANDNVMTDVSWNVYAKPGCDTGWSFYRGWCYKLLELQSRTWLQWEQECLRLGAGLAKIGNKAKQDVIWNNAMLKWATIATKSLAIGLCDLDEDGTFTWRLDGSTPTFTMWMDHHDLGGFPKTYDYDNQTCVFMQGTHGWYNPPCKDMLPGATSAVCEKLLH